MAARRARGGGARRLPCPPGAQTPPLPRPAAAPPPPIARPQVWSEKDGGLPTGFGAATLAAWAAAQGE